jgi:hypothetical protein
MTPLPKPGRMPYLLPKKLLACTNIFMTFALERLSQFQDRGFSHSGTCELGERFRRILLDIAF